MAEQEQEEEKKEKKQEQEVVYEKPEKPDEVMKGGVLELLDRILDKGLVIIGDIRISVADIELLKIQIRLLIASVDKAKEMGIDFSWAKSIEDPKTEEELKSKISELQKKFDESKKSEAKLDPTE